MNDLKPEFLQPVRTLKEIKVYAEIFNCPRCNVLLDTKFVCPTCLKPCEKGNKEQLHMILRDGEGREESY